MNAVGYTPIHNIAGCPGMSVPLHWSDEGLPIGTHFAAHDDDRHPEVAENGLRQFHPRARGEQMLHHRWRDRLGFRGVI